MIKLIANPKFLMLLPLVLAISNVIIPVINYHKTLRNTLMLIISGFFFLSILLLGHFFENIELINFNLLTFSQFTITFHIESLGIIFLNLLAILWIFSLIYTINYLEFNDIPNQNQFLFFFNLSILVGIFIAISANLFTMLIFYELLTIVTVPLIIHQPTNKTSANIGKYLKILLTTSMIFFLPAVTIIYAKLGHGNFIMNGILLDKFSTVFNIILLILFILGISKTAIFPFSGWLPAAMVATYPVSALLHSVVVVNAGLFCIFKILVYIFGLEYLQILFHTNNWLLLIPIITIGYSAFMAIRTTHIKEILAYSTITQLSIALLSAFLFTSVGIKAAIAHMISHSFSKITLFYSIGIIYSLKKGHHINDLPNTSNEIKMVSFITLLAVLSLIGVPPLAGFFSKFYIMQAASYSNNLLVLITLAISSILSAIYLTKLLSIFYIKETTTTEKTMSNNNNSLISQMIFATICCSMGIILFYSYYHKIDYYLRYINE